MKNNRGFSLMEVLIAMILLAGVGALTLFAFSSSQQSAQPGSNVAYNFGRGQIEQMFERVRMKNAGGQDQWNVAGLPLSKTSPGPQGTVKALNGKTYTANYTVAGSDRNADGDDDYRKVRMTVSW